VYEADMNWDQRVAADAAVSERVAFIKKTYLHVAGSLVALTVMLAALVNFVPNEFLNKIFGRGSYAGPLVIFIGFIAISYAARSMAQGHKPIGMQYLGLGLYSAALAFVLWPAIWVCTNVAQYSGVLGQAVILTLALAGGLTVSVLVTKIDFSFMRSALCVLSFVAIAAMFAGFVFQFDLGLLFSIAMVVLLGGFILYNTSNVLHHYGTHEYVAAALEIFSSIVVMFSWILDIMMRGRE
jgi:FtsH-binding integral membrane protein